MRKIVVVLGLLVSQSVFSSPVVNSYWFDVADDSRLPLKTLSKIDVLQKPLKRRMLTLNEQDFRNLLTGAVSSLDVNSFQAKQSSTRLAKANNEPVEIDLPLPDGSFTLVKIFDSPLLSPELAEQYPQIRTWRVQGVDKPAISGRLDFTSEGFHGMLNMPDGDTVYIDPDENGTADLYQSLSKFDNLPHFKTDFNCQAHDLKSILHPQDDSDTQPNIHPQDDSDTKPNIHPQDDSDTKPNIHPQDDSETQPNIHPQDDSETQPNIHPQDDSETQPNIHPQDDSETQPNIHPQDDPDPQPNIHPQDDPDPQPNIHQEYKTVAEKKLSQTPALDLITYRLAIAGTAEYTASQGGTRTQAYESMVTTINRVNDIYQRDLGVRLQLVSGNNFTYTNASTDPYTNTNARELVAENIANLNTNFGAANYDIGHVFAQGPLGGLAYIGATCQDVYKAGGATGITKPQGEIFSIEFVAHEMGHQLGATHTFNSEKAACGNNNRSEVTAVEPGSGSTIMSYSGLCESDNVQFTSDAMFHWISIDQVNHYTRVEEGNSCGTTRSTGNQNPVANAGTDGIIPRDTPFLLDGSATSSASHSWEQIDAGQASQIGIDTGDNSIIRTNLPTSSDDRYIPSLSNLFAGTSTLTEVLPQTVRELNFVFVARDNQGGIDSDLKVISVKDTGSRFKVLSQANSESFTTGEYIDVAWLVGGTNADPISCSKVDIQLLRVNGAKDMLLANTDNDGGQQLVIPVNTPALTGARIMVACSNQPFFQISSGNVSILKGTNVVDTTAPVINLIGADYIELVKGTAYADSGATATDNVDSIISVSVTGNVNIWVTGVYIVTYSASDFSGNTSTLQRTIKVLKSGTDNKNDDSSAGGSLSFWLLSFVLIGLRRVRLALRS